MNKKWKVLFAVGTGLILAKHILADSEPELNTVSHVDLTRYVGKWYEIARYPNWFEKNGDTDVTAEYTARQDGKITVVNFCRRADATKVSKGEARVTDKTTNAKLKVAFFKPFYGNYWIIDLASNYSYAVVGEPSRKHLWILSRTPTMAEETYGEITRRVQELGYDTAKLIKTPQSQN
jgi:apolipoprotein D and lipocalin family protein